MLAILIASSLVSASGVQELVWFRTFGGIDSEELSQCIECSDTGFALIGTTRSISGTDDMWLVKTDPSGQLEWSAVFGGSDGDYGVAVFQMADSGFLLAGTTYSYGAGQGDAWLVRTDSYGGLLWERTYGTPVEDWFYDMSSCWSGGFIAVGAQGVYPSDMKIWLVKLNDDGDVIWEQTYGGGATDCGRCVVQTADGGYIIAGENESSSSGSADGWLIKTDSIGVQEWDIILGGFDYDRFNQVRQTADGGYVAAGFNYSSSGIGTSDLWIVKVDPAGTVEWDSLYGGSNGNESAEWIEVQPDGDLLLAGYNSSINWPVSDLWVVKTDSVGEMEWEFIFEGSEVDWGTCLVSAADGSLVVGGWTESYGAGDSDYLLVKIQEPQGGASEESSESYTDFMMSVSPSPFSTATTIQFELHETESIKLAVYDTTGRLIENLFTGTAGSGNYILTWDASQSLPNGCYLIVLDAYGERVVRRCVRLN